MKFKRAIRQKNKKDERGRVEIRVVMRRSSGAGVLNGNISRSFTVEDNKVSAVAAAIERALFG